ncbi:MAG: hypothetical protein ACRCX2_33920 [Paraclostridium sp.]
MLFKARVETYTFSEWREMQQAKEHELNTFDKFLGHIKKNKKVYTELVVTVAIFLFITGFKVITDGDVVEVMATTQNLTWASLMSKAEGFGNALVLFAARTGRYAILILMIYGIVKDAFEGANHRILNKALFFFILLLLISIAPYLQPVIDSLIESMFNGGN